jgi:putative addiction module component (TIGR02574 family)
MTDAQEKLDERLGADPPWMAPSTRGSLADMGRVAPLPPPGFDDMSVEDKIDYVQALWDRIAANESQVPIPDWHREVLEERLADYQANRDQGRPWEEVEADLLKQRR